MLEKLKANCNFDGTAAVAWFVLKLAQKSAVREDPAIIEIVQELRKSTACGAKDLSAQLDTMFNCSNVDNLKSELHEADPLSLHAATLSLQAAKASMRPPGTRDHDNDKENFRDIDCVPTPSELNCTEKPFLPPSEGSEYISNPETKVLDRQFCLLREDLVGPVREELIEELKSKPASIVQTSVRKPQNIEHSI